MFGVWLGEFLLSHTNLELRHAFQDLTFVENGERITLMICHYTYLTIKDNPNRVSRCLQATLATTRELRTSRQSFWKSGTPPLDTPPPTARFLEQEWAAVSFTLPPSPIERWKHTRRKVDVCVASCCYFRWIGDNKCLQCLRERSNFSLFATEVLMWISRVVWMRKIYLVLQCMRIRAFLFFTLYGRCLLTEELMILCSRRWIMRVFQTFQKDAKGEVSFFTFLNTCSIFRKGNSRKKKLRCTRLSQQLR